MKLNQACYKPRQLKIMSLNIFTLLKHLDELRILAEQHKPDILAINETKIDTDIDDHEILIDGYHVESLDIEINLVVVLQSICMKVLIIK